MLNNGYYTLPRAEITFTYISRDDDDNEITRVVRTIRNDDAEYLPTILNAFLLFLQGMTFTYVDEVKAVSEKGTEYASDML